MNKHILASDRHCLYHSWLVLYLAAGGLLTGAAECEATSCGNNPKLERRAPKYPSYNKHKLPQCTMG